MKNQSVLRLVMNQKLLLALVFAPVAVALGRGIVSFSLQYTFIVGLLPLAGWFFLVCFRHPQYLIWLMLGLLFFGDRREIAALYFWGRYLPILGVLGLLAVVAARKFVLDKKQTWQGKEIIYGYALFVGLMLISSFYNNTKLSDIILGLGTNLRYPLFFVALVNANFTMAFYQRIIEAFMSLTKLQLFIVFFQFFILGYRVDSVVGTLNSNTLTMAFVLYAQCILFARWLVMRDNHYLFTFLALTLIPILASIQVAFFFLPFLIGYIAFRYYGMSNLMLWVTSLLPILGILFVIIAFSFFLHAEIKRNLTETFSTYITIEYYYNPNPGITNHASIGRLTIYQFAVPLLFQDPLRVIWGFGIDATRGSALTASRGASLAERAASSGVVCQILLEDGVFCRETQAFRSLMEYGLLGSFLFIAPMVWLWRLGSRLLRRDGVESQILGLSFEGTSFFFIVLGFLYTGVWRFDAYSFMFWFLAAAVWTEHRRLSASDKEEAKITLASDRRRFGKRTK